MPAKVFFTPFASKNTPEDVKEGLTRAGGFLRGEVGRRLGLRHAPKLEFEFDDSFEKAAKLTALDRQGAEVARRELPWSPVSCCSTSPWGFRRTVRFSA